MRQIETYTYTIPDGDTIALPAANDNFIILAATGTVTVRGDTFGTLKNLVAGQGLKLVPFNRLELVNTSGAPNTVSILLSPAEFVNQVFSGSVSVVGDLGLNVSTLNTLIRPLLPGAYFKSSAILAANTAEVVFTAASNVNGALVHSLGAMSSTSTSAAIMSYLLKATAPASAIDGDVIAQGALAFSGASAFWSLQVHEPIRVPAGVGLYFISSVAEVAGNSLRHARYTFL